MGGRPMTPGHSLSLRTPIRTRWPPSEITGEPRFQEVLRRASVRGDGMVDGAMYERCAECHDPLRLTVPVASGTEQTPLPLGEGGSEQIG